MIPLKKAIVLSTLTVLSILLVGCGNNSKTDTNSTSDSDFPVEIEDSSTSDSDFPVEIEDSSTSDSDFPVEIEDSSN